MDINVKVNLVIKYQFIFLRGSLLSQTEAVEYLAAVWLPFKIGVINCQRRLRVGTVSPTATPMSLLLDFIAVSSVHVLAQF